MKVRFFLFLPLFRIRSLLLPVRPARGQHRRADRYGDRDREDSADPHVIFRWSRPTCLRSNAVTRLDVIDQVEFEKVPWYRVRAHDEAADRGLDRGAERDHERARLQKSKDAGRGNSRTRPRRRRA